MLYISIVEHPLNDFESMDQKIFNGIIKPQVIDYIKNDVQMVFGELEQNMQSVFDLLVQLKSNKANTTLTTKLIGDAEALLEKISE